MSQSNFLYFELSNLKLMNLVQYFKSIYKNYCFITVLIVLFFTITISLNVLKIQIFPFVAYGMYSEVEMPENFQTFEIILDGMKVDIKNDLNYASRDFILNRLHYYSFYLENSKKTRSNLFISNHPKMPSIIKEFKDKVLTTQIEDDNFPIWLNDYLKHFYTFKTLEVHIIHLTKSNGGIVFDHKVKLF